MLWFLPNPYIFRICMVGKNLVPAPERDTCFPSTKIRIKAVKTALVGKGGRRVGASAPLCLLLKEDSKLRSFQ